MATHGDHPELPDEVEAMLDEDVSTLFLKAGCLPRTKRGHIGQIKLIEVEGQSEWENLAMERLQSDLESLVEANQDRPDCFREINRIGCMVLQLGDLRITCASPPFSDAREITIVRPVVKLSLDQYDLDPRLIERLSDHQRGVFISGRPGSGKTTLAQAVAEYLDSEMGQMVKTMEAPRDLQLAARITQYAPLEGDLEKTSEIIFLVRPDFVIFDEVRRARDFEIFSDVRLAGVGLLGVTHANSALEAIQRLIGKVELGLVPQVLDTILHVEHGKIVQVLELRMVVKPPTGMQDDLSRPVIEVVRFPSGKVSHEMFAFGSEISVVPVDGVGGTKSPILRFARHGLCNAVRDMLHMRCEVDLVSTTQASIYVPDRMVGAAVGPQGSMVKDMEEELGLNLQIKPMSEMPRSLSKTMEQDGDAGFDIQEMRSRQSRAWETHKGGKRKKGKRRRK
ncbi:MAG: ATPase, T2SS/T4P/T4SS family [Candidatus Poseidoniaceae archaeon]|jgi:ATPase|nr:ATPase, T2SS/T4P/T4SS family [Candidatus Poseidoniaceae archaeon]